MRYNKEQKECTSKMPVKINVKTTIFQDKGKDVIESIASGRFYQKDIASFLQYEEEAAEGSIRTIVKLAEAEALILRSGAVKMRMPFSLNKELQGSYELPFGKFETAAVAKKIEHSYNAKSGEGYIDLLYDFFMQGNPAGTYHLEITFKEEDNEHS
jgi:uncharacterized beta-barrel protein YwiB (DUF1934 family)